MDKIKEALGKLDKDNPADWTQAGLPSVERVRELAGDDTITRSQIGEAYPGFDREGPATKDDAGANSGSGEQADPNARFKQGEERGEGLGNPNDAMNNAERISEEAGGVGDKRDVPEYESERTELTPAEIAKHCPDAILLLEAAVAAGMSGRFSRNSALQTLLRGYQVAQTEIKEVQVRLDKRISDRDEENARAKEKEAEDNAA